MVTFVRIAPRLYVPESRAANPEHARVYFVVGPAALGDRINPAHKMADGTLVVAPHLKPHAWLHARANLAAEVDNLDGGRHQLAFLAPGGGLRPGDVVRVRSDGTVATGTYIAIGSPEFGTPWNLLIPEGAAFSADAASMTLTLPPGKGKLELPGSISVAIPKLENRCAIDIDWDGPARGALRFRAPVDANQLEALGVGPRYFANSPEDADGGKIAIESYAYPLLALAGKPEIFGFQIDCASPHEDEPADATESTVRLPRSTLTPPDHGLRSHLHQVHAGEVLLKPAQEADQLKGCFALTVSPHVLKTTSTGRELQSGAHYFTPVGAFAVEAEDPAREQIRLTLGLSHLENVTVRKTDRLLFVPSQPAYENRRAILEAVAGAEEAATALDRLDGYCTTSWMRLVPGAAVEADVEPFSLQPEGMQAYAPPQENAQVLEFRAVRYPNAGKAFPVGPLLGVVDSADERAQADARRRLAFEQSVIALARRREIISGPAISPSAGAAESEPTRARTPQGYLASRTGSARAWNSILFTRTSLREADGKFPELGSVAISAPEGSPAATHLAAVLAQNRLMLVTTWKKLAQLQFDLGAFTRLHVGGWGIHIGGSLPLSVSAESTADFDPLVVIKYADRSIAELARDESQWVLRETFSDAPMRNRFHGAIADAKNDPLRQPLQRRLQDPNWNGLLLLDARLPLTGIPTQMRAIAAGLPPYLEVPYAGLDITGIDPNQPGDQPWKSALFGLVHHDNANIEFFKGASGIGMRVPKLVVRVENDGIDRFNCKLELRLPGLFDVQAANPEEDLQLEGRYESAVVDGRRRETFTFATEKEITKTFSESNVVKSATFRRMRLVTHSAEGTHTLGSFVIDGSIAFHKVLDSDLFGIEKLDFTDLAIDLDFKLGGTLKLDLNYPKLRFDLDLFNSGHGRRDKPGFMEAFPLKLRGFRFGDFKLPELGFFDLGNLAPSESFQISDAFKFGLDFDLDLGSLGALAEKLDRFKLQIVLGWKPVFDGTTFRRNDIAAGFRIDFGKGSGGIDLGLQGILRLWADRFNLKRVSEMFVLAADDCHIDILGKTLPEQGQNFSLYLFANPKGGKPFERLGWFASFKDKNPKDPIKVETLVLAQRVDVRFDQGGINTVNTTSKALKWLDVKQDFSGDGGVERFVEFAGKSIDYDRNRELFLALKGDFFKVLRLGLVLKDPEMYGAYLGFLADDNNPEAAPFSFDLLYQKLANGVGRYSVEVGLPPGYRTFECGVVSVTLGMLRMEVYTDGGFLFDLGFPEHVDYTRSYAVQAAIFIGKGGLYLGRVPPVTVPNMPEPGEEAFLPVFRSGFAMKVGFGREFEQGPLRAGLSICVFGRMEGYFAMANKDKRGPDGRMLAPFPYWMRLHGEVGLIAEIEGCVDLRLIRARVLVRVWIATGIVLETALPIVLYCEAGVSVAIEFQIASFKVFGRRIRITVMLRYSTTLRYEFQLPAKVPVFQLPGAPEVEGLAQPQERVKILGNWPSPTADRLGVKARSIDLRLGYDFSAAGRGGTAEGGHEGALLVPTVLWLVGDEHNKDSRPFETIVRGLVAWAALRTRPDEADASRILLRKDPGGELDLEWLECSIRGLDDLPLEIHEAFFSAIAPGSRLRHIPEGGQEATGFLFPLPPKLRIEMKWNGGTRVRDFAQLGRVSAQAADAIFSDLERQFAEVSARAREAATESEDSQPLVDYIFRSWCTALALSACDAARTQWKTEAGAGATRTVREFLDALADTHWNEVASRAGRLLLSGARTAASATLLVAATRPIAEAAGLFMAFPAGATDTQLDPVEGTGPAWLDVQADPMDVAWAQLAAVATASVAVKIESAQVAASRRLPRRFYQPSPLQVQNGEVPAVLCRFSGDLLLSSSATPFGKLAFSAAKTSNTPGQLPVEGAALRSARAALVFEMTLARLTMAGTLTDAGDSFAPSAFRIAGSSEADRLGLDALIDHMARPDSQLSLVTSRLLVGWREGEEPSAYVELLPIATHLGDCVVVRSTVSIERRPAAVLEGSEAESNERPESSFFATFEPAYRYRLLYALRRAAIVNAEGTHLLLPDAVAALVRDKFQATGTTERTVKLMLAVVFEPGTELPQGVRNAALFEDAADLQLLAQPERRVVAQLANLSDATGANDPMVEVVPTRPAGTELVRLWRKRTAAAAAGAVSAASLGAHLGQRFDMLEFQLRRAGASEPLLAFQESLPLGSEEAVPPPPQDEAHTTGYPQALRAQLAEEMPAGFQDTDLRYDLIVPLSKLLDPSGNRYAAVGKEFELDIGWRDVWGNRLGAEGGATLPLAPRYTDAVVPLASWPCVKARAYPGGAGSRTLVLSLVVDFQAVPSSEEERLAAANELHRVMDQVSDPNSPPTLRSGLGTVTNSPNAQSLRDFLRAIESALRANQVPGAAEWNHEAQVIIDPARDFLPISLEFSVLRHETLVKDGRPEVPGVASAWSPMRMDSRAGAAPQKPEFQRDFATEFQAAFTFDDVRLWAALGTSEDAQQDWWAMNDRMIPATTPSAPQAYAVPPMARALMSATVTAQVPDAPDFAVRRPVVQLVRDRDLDALLASFLDRVETFLSPSHAHCTALATRPAGADRPFERVARAKAQLLGEADQPSPLLQTLRPVFARSAANGEDQQLKDAATAELREACAPDLRRFYEVACVMVKHLQPRLEPGWIQAKGHARPKLYGRLKIGGAAGSAAPFRAMTRGIPLDPESMQIAFPIMSNLQSDAVQADLGRIDFEVTHVEREIKSQEPGVLSASRWLTLVPVLANVRLPMIEVSDGAKAPLPRRRVPVRPTWGEHRSEPYLRDSQDGTYAAQVQAARRWTYAFDLEAEFKASDEVCGRLLYNLPAGSTSAAGEAPQSAEQPVIDKLFDRLAEHDLEVTQYWEVILSESKRRTSGEPVHQGFENACNRFAESVESVVGAFAAARVESEKKGPDQDRFILTDEPVKVGGQDGRKTVIRFADHFVGDTPVQVLAGEGQPWLRIQRVLEGSRPSDATAGLGVDGRGIDPANVYAEFIFDGTQEKSPGRACREVSVGRLDALRQQSVWVAASVRRNRVIGKDPLDEAFVYRTAESFLHQAKSPQIVHRKPILLIPDAPSTLEDLIADGLRPALKGLVADRGAYVQMSVDYESGRLTHLVEAAFGAIGTPSGFGLQPDPKIVIAATKVNDGEAASLHLAREAATRLRAHFAMEPVGQATDGSRGRIVLNLTLSAASEVLSGPGQTILQLERLVLDLSRVDL